MELPDRGVRVPRYVPKSPGYVAGFLMSRSAAAPECRDSGSRLAWRNPGSRPYTSGTRLSGDVFAASSLRPSLDFNCSWQLMTRDPFQIGCSAVKYTGHSSQSESMICCETTWLLPVWFKNLAELVLSWVPIHRTVDQYFPEATAQQKCRNGLRKPAEDERFPLPPTPAPVLPSLFLA